MDTQRWLRAGDIFEQIFGRPPAERTQLVAELCGDDAELRGAVVSMLDDEDSARAFEDVAAAIVQHRTTTQGNGGGDAESARIGPWRLERRLGDGGMGVVWLAERADGQFEQRAALKLIKRGMDSEAVLARFLRERQILARLQHPRIAHLLDGGIAADGRPYFAMEYVDGLPLLQWCHEHNTRLEDRIRLFLDVCAAVQFAHEQHVVHRDLKPSNVLVTAKGEVKLLDFGIAKLLGAGTPGEPTLTQARHERPMSPAYAAPEQFRGDKITPATDIYALGAVLYQLLTEKYAYDFHSAAAPADMQRIIEASDPVAPSRLRLSAPPVPQKRLRGDLDTIVLTALRHEPQRRYASVAAFADDLRNYLNGKPISARRDHLLYRGWKFMRRHRVGVAAALLVGAAVAVPALLNLRSAPALAFANRDWVVIGDLENQTGAALYNDSVPGAFRIGLEQSRYVNLLPALKVRETLALMQRDPGSRVDRAVGSEVAIRDGARALILPTIAAFGNRLRFTAEVIDPQTQATVYTESADGDGPDSVLASLDRVGQKLRVRLGEALAAVSKDSQPLERVATKNLDALKSYSLAQQAYDEFRLDEAMVLYRQAIAFDPDFALARAGLARCYVVTGQPAEAVKELKSALALDNRLLARERLFVESTLASIAETPRAALEKWRAFIGVYPDDLNALSDYPFYAWTLANRYDAQIVDAARAAVSPRNPHPINARILLASLYLGNERYAEAIDQYRQAEGIATARRTVDLAAALAVRRQFDDAAEASARNRSDGTAEDAASAYWTQIAISADRGDWAAVWQTLARAQKLAADVSPAYLLKFRIIELSLRQLTGSGSADLRAFVDAARETLAQASPFDRSEIQEYLLFAAYLAAMQDDAVYAAKVLDMAGPEPRSGGYPILGKLFAVAQAEIARRTGHAEDAVSLLQATLDGTELYLTHVALADAQAAAGDLRAAQEQVQWLAAHRGRAYIEFGAPSIVAYDVAQTDLAPLRGAELSRQSGNTEAARRNEQEFLTLWPAAASVPALSARLAALASP